MHYNHIGSGARAALLPYGWRYVFTLNDAIKFKLSFLIKDALPGRTSLDINAFFLTGRACLGRQYLSFGSPLYNKSNLQNSLQKPNAVIGMIEFFATERLHIGYAFDYSLTPLSNYSYGSHELSIGIYLSKGYHRIDL